MKKLFYILLLLPVLMLTSCSKDEEPQLSKPTEISVVKTTWEHLISYGSAAQYKVTLEFTTSADYKRTEVTSFPGLAETVNNISGTYTLDSKTGKITFGAGQGTAMVTDSILTYTNGNQVEEFKKK